MRDQTNYLVNTIFNAQKAAQWEIAKGQLRAMVAIQGSHPSSVSVSDSDRWKNLSELVDEFVQSVEDGGLHE